MYLKAVRFLRDKGPFKAGDILTTTEGMTRVFGPFGAGKSTFLRAIAEYHIDGNRDDIECNYANSVPGLSDETDISAGTVHIDFTTTLPTVIGNLDSDIMNDLRQLAEDNNRTSIISYLADNVDKALILLDEPMTQMNDFQCPLRRVYAYHSRWGGVREERYNQVLSTAASCGYYWDSVLSIGNKCVVSNKFARCARKLEHLMTPLHASTDKGFVVRISKKNLTHYSHSNTEYFYLAGNSELVDEPSNAYLYKSKAAAENAIYGITSSHWPPYWRLSHRGGKGTAEGANKCSPSCYEILTKEQYDELLFGKPVTPIKKEEDMYGGL